MIRTGHRTLLVALLLSTPFISSGKDSATWVLASTSSAGSPVSLRRQADRVVLELILTCDQSTPDDRVDELENAVTDLTSRLKSASCDELATSAFFNSTGNAAGLSLLNLGDEKAATAALYAAKPIRDKDDSLFSVAEPLAAAADTFTPQGAVDLIIGNAYLAVEQPEQYREELQKKILAHAFRLRELSGTGAILHLSGLEGPVQVRQIDNRNVELFIDYKLTLELFDPEELTGKAPHRL